MTSQHTLMVKQLALAASLIGASPAFAGPHEHGVAHMNLAIEGSKLEIAVKVPLESLLGYERAPRTDAEKAAAAAVLERFKQTQPVLALPAQAQCRQAAPAQVKAPLLEGRAGSGSAHGDLEASYQLECGQVGELRNMDVTLFDVSKGISRVKAQVAAPQGQSQSVLRRNKRQLKLGR